MTRAPDHSDAATEASILRNPSVKPDVLVFFTDCKSDSAYGDFTQCGSLAYAVKKNTQPLNLRIVLTSSATGITRFDRLFRSASTDNHMLYGHEIFLYTNEAFQQSADQFNIRGYVEVAFCKPNPSTYVNNILQTNNTETKAAFVGTANYDHSQFYSAIKDKNAALLTQGKAKGLMTGYGQRSDGITFTSFSSFVNDIPKADLQMHPSIEELIKQNNRFGLIYVPTEIAENDKQYVTRYFTHFFARQESNTVIAIGPFEKIKSATKAFRKTDGRNIELCNLENEQSLSLTSPPPSSTNKAKNPLHIVVLKSVPYLHMRKLLAHANQFVGLSGCSSTIEGFGEGKIVYYQYQIKNEPFIASYLAALTLWLETQRSPCTQEVITLTTLLLRITSYTGTAYQAAQTQLSEALKVEDVCSLLAASNEKMTRARNQLSYNLLNWLGLRPTPDTPGITIASEHPCAC